MEIKIQHKGLNSFEVMIDDKYVSVQYTGKKVIRIQKKLNQGWHVLSVKCLHEAMIKMISFKTR